MKGAKVDKREGNRTGDFFHEMLKKKKKDIYISCCLLKLAFLEGLSVVPLRAPALATPFFSHIQVRTRFLHFFLVLSSMYLSLASTITLDGAFSLVHSLFFPFLLSFFLSFVFLFLFFLLTQWRIR
jgi:hypothetical protein